MEFIDIIEDFKSRLKLLSENPKGYPEVTAFVEITISEQQLNIISDPLYGVDGDELLKYYKNKIHGNLLLSSSKYTYREEQPDFQYLFDLGVQALKSGMVRMPERIIKTRINEGN